MNTRQRAWRLSGRARKVWLIVHLVSTGAWIGLDLVMAVFVATAAMSDDNRVKAVCYQGLALFATWPMISLAVLSLVTGVVLSVGGKYGLIRYWWVTIKLGLNVVLGTLVVFALRPGVLEVAEYGRQLAAGASVERSVIDLAFPPIVSTTALLFAVVLSVFKPWGRIRPAAFDSPAPAVGQPARRSMLPGR